MVSFTLLQMAMLAAVVTNAAPFTDAAPYDSIQAARDAPFSKRATPEAVTCGQNSNVQKWTQTQVQDAFNALAAAGVKPKNQQPAAGGRAYPMQYGNNKGVPSDKSVVAALDKIAGCETGQSGFKFFEFPITDPTFNGGPAGSQGPDRVIAISANIKQGGTRTYTYCLSVTHRDETTAGDFDPCT